MGDKLPIGAAVDALLIYGDGNVSKIARQFGVSRSCVAGRMTALVVSGKLLASKARLSDRDVKPANEPPFITPPSRARLMAGR